MKGLFLIATMVITAYEMKYLLISTDGNRTEERTEAEHGYDYNDQYTDYNDQYNDYNNYLDQNGKYELDVA